MMIQLNDFYYYIYIIKLHIIYIQYIYLKNNKSLLVYKAKNYKKKNYYMYTKKEMKIFLKKRVTNTFLLLYYIYNIYTYLNIIYTPFLYGCLYRVKT